MIDADLLTILERIAVALECIARQLTPDTKPKTPRPATLTKAVYTREEREIRDFKAGKETRPTGDPA